MQKLKRAVQNNKLGLFFLPLALVAGASAFTAPVFAAPPVENVSCILGTEGAPNKLNCTSNDVLLSTPIVDVIEPCSFPGDTATLQVVVDVTLNSKTRYDVGVWVSVDGDPNSDGSESGMCSVVSIPNDIFNADGNSVNLDGDACGDVENAAAAGADIVGADLGTFDVLCVDTDGDGNINVPLIVAWDNSSAQVCNASDETVPQTGAKCSENLDGNLPVPIPAQLIVNKTTPGGSTQDFNFNLTGPVPGDWAGDWAGAEAFMLANGETYDTALEINGGLPEGNGYSLAETPVNGFISTGSCISSLDGIATNANPAALNLRTGEILTCTFINTPEGSLSVTKVTFGGDDTFGYTHDIGAATPFNIVTSNGVGSDGGALGQVAAGTYTITESTIPAGWVLAGAECQNQNQQVVSIPNGNGVDVTITSTDTVACEFVNFKTGTIVVRKVTNPAGSPGSFTFTGDAAGSIGHNETIQVSDLDPGTYTSTESANASFNLTNVTCDDNNSSGDSGTRTATFNVEAGETVTCTFTNTVPTIIPPDPTPKVIHPIPVNNQWALLLLALMVLGVGWHFRPARRKMF